MSEILGLGDGSVDYDPGPNCKVEVVRTSTTDNADVCYDVNLPGDCPKDRPNPRCSTCGGGGQRLDVCDNNRPTLVANEASQAMEPSAVRPMADVLQVAVKPAEFALVSEIMDLGCESGDVDPAPSSSLEVLSPGHGEAACLLYTSPSPRDA